MKWSINYSKKHGKWIDSVWAWTDERNTRVTRLLYIIFAFFTASASRNILNEISFNGCSSLSFCTCSGLSVLMLFEATSEHFGDLYEKKEANNTDSWWRRKKMFFRTMEYRTVCENWWRAKSRGEWKIVKMKRKHLNEKYDYIWRGVAIGSEWEKMQNTVMKNRRFCIINFHLMLSFAAVLNATFALDAIVFDGVVACECNEM